jgi:hypothetical protein
VVVACPPCLFPSCLQHYFAKSFNPGKTNNLIDIIRIVMEDMKVCSCVWLAGNSLCAMQSEPCRMKNMSVATGQASTFSIPCASQALLTDRWWLLLPACCPTDCCH